MKVILVILLLALAVTVRAADKDQSTAIGYLETRDRTITLWAGPQPRYTVRTKDGKVLAEKISAAELKKRYPDLSRINEATTVAWAGM